MLEPQAAKRVRLVGLDVDGVMTDAGVYVGLMDGRPVEFKRFDIQDGVGVHLLRGAGIRVIVLSGRRSDASRLRAEELGIDDIVQDDRARKLPAFEQLLSKYGLRMEDAAFVGDDLPDLPVLRRVGLPVAVANAVPDVLAVAHHVTHAHGGRGAIREFAEELLRARQEWETVLQAYLTERGDRESRMSRAASH